MSTETPNRTQDGGHEAPYTEKATSYAHDAVDRLSDRAEDAEERIRHAAAHSAEAIRARREQAEMQLHTSIDQARQFTIENPLLTIGLAFAAGMILNSLRRATR